MPRSAATRTSSPRPWRPSSWRRPTGSPPPPPARGGPLPRPKRKHGVDCPIVNVENAAAGFGVTPQIARSFLDGGVDVMTSGNHIWDRKEIIEYIVKENLLLRPANYPAGTPGVGSVVVEAGPHKVAVLSLMGRVFLPTIDCPFRKAD